MISQTCVERARQTSILAVLDMLRVRTRKISAVERAGPCPHCGGRDRFSVNTKKQVFNCRGCGAKGDVIALVQHVDGCSFPEAVEKLVSERWRPSERPEVFLAAELVKADPEPSDERLLAIAANIVAEMRPLISEPRAVAYLRDARKIDVAAIEDVLKRTDALGWHGSLYFNEPHYPEPDDPPHPLHGQKLGAIIGIMTDAVTADPTGAISRTYIGPDGTKVLKAKTLGSPRGIIRLSPDDEVLGGLFLAEGIETALSGMAKGLRPMWATGDCGVMSDFPVLDGIEALNIIADHDDNGAGEKAAREVGTRWLAAGREVNLFLPKAEGDLNDVLKGDQ